MVQQNINYEYSTDIAVNNNHVYTVNDSDAQNDAMIEYEYQKTLLMRKKPVLIQE